MTKEHHDGFVRQRRSLILISLVLSVVVWFGIDGTKVRLGPGGGAGLSVDLLDTRVVYARLVIMWAWFAVRYWQYYSVIHEDAVKELYAAQAARLKAVFGKRLRALADEAALKQVKLEGNQQAKVGDRGPREEPIRDGWRSVSQRFRLAVSIKDHRGNQQSQRNAPPFTASVSGRQLYGPLLRAIAPVNAKHPYFTEYWLPFVIAAVPVFLLPFQWENVFGSSPQLEVNCSGLEVELQADSLCYFNSGCSLSRDELTTYEKRLTSYQQACLRN